MIFLFTGESGQQYGYDDTFQDDGTFWYTGEGQRGDMRMERGNRAIRDHLQTGKILHLFEQAERGLVRYVGEATYLGHHTEPRPDLDGNTREAIIFELAVEGNEEGRPISPERASTRDHDAGLWSRSLDELYQLAMRASTGDASTQDRRVNVRLRSRAVKIYVLRRANGVCEGCGNPAPFKKPNGQPFLESHHIRRLADLGPDHPRWVAALCPNCHRRAHEGEDRDRFNKRLADQIQAIEGARSS
ncbi:MAG TPA: HNH endonuclease [Thermoanaerobaculia bacterium]|nr:HNH endonuclease [Thermoanaerobaculia bacterium]